MMWGSIAASWQNDDTKDLYARFESPGSAAAAVKALDPVEWDE